MQHAGLVLRHGQLQQAIDRRSQGAVDLGFMLRGEVQAVASRKDEQAQGGRLAVHFQHLAGESRQALQGHAVETQHAVHAGFGGRQQSLRYQGLAEQCHQGLMPRCRATMPPVMLW
ncbi:hypothetical protein D3C81_2027280 [compost metagenome]